MIRHFMQALALAVFLIHMLPGAASAGEDTDRLLSEMAKLETQPCNTQLRFSKLVVGWYITCPGCAAIPAGRVYPRAVIDLVDQWAVNGELSITSLLRMYGDCP